MLELIISVDLDANMAKVACGASGSPQNRRAVLDAVRGQRETVPLAVN